MNETPSLPFVRCLSSACSTLARRLALPAAGAAVALLFGCTTEPAAHQAADTTKYTLENTDRFVALDRATQQAVSCTGMQYHSLADGRLELVANLKNRESRRIELQASCVFTDEQGVLVVEETPWKAVTLSEHTTEAVRFVANNASARKYTVRVKQAK